MKKLYIILITVLLAATTSLGLAADAPRDSGSAPGGAGVRFDTPRGFGEEASQDETQSHERMFNESAPGAWSNDPATGKAKPSDDKK